MSELKKLAIKLGTEGPHKTMATPRRVQIVYGGTWIIRTTKAVYTWEHPYYPQLYLPSDELEQNAKRTGFSLDVVSTITTDSGQEVAKQYALSIPSGGPSTDQILVFSPTVSDRASALRGLAKIPFATPAMQWFEEDTPIQVHPKDPFTRIDILQSRREIKVSVAGRAIAHTAFAFHLHETGLPARFYIPPTAWDQSVLAPSETRTKCPYKGEAEYYHVRIVGETYEDLVWYYRSPTLESAQIVGLLCPYNERVDIELDGVKLERPDTPFGKKKAA